MNESLLAGRYAKALLAQAESLGQAGLLYPIMGQVAVGILGSKNLSALLKNPTEDVATKKQAVMSLVRESASEQKAPKEGVALLGSFVDMVFDHHRESSLAHIALAYKRLYRKLRGIVQVNLTTPQEPSKEMVDKLASVVKERVGGEVEMVCHVNPLVEGGFVLRVDDLQLDASLKGQLDKIRREFIRKNRTIV